MKLKLIADSKLLMEDVSDIILGLQRIGHTASAPAGLAGQQHNRLSLDSQDALHNDFTLIQAADAVLLVNSSGPCTACQLLELGVASYLRKPVFALQPMGDRKLERDLKAVVIDGNLNDIPKELLG